MLSRFVVGYSYKEMELFFCCSDDGDKKFVFQKKPDNYIPGYMQKPCIFKILHVFSDIKDSDDGVSDCFLSLVCVLLLRI
jgi:hypothetical protein